MPVFIEFFGLPGAGKTTLSKELARRLGDDFVNTSELTGDDRWKWRRRLGKARLYFSANLDEEHRPLLKAAFKVRQSSFRNRVKAFFPLATFFTIRSQLKAKGQSAIFDQGILQSVYSLVYSAVDEKQAETAMSKLIDWSAKSRQVHVILDTPADTCRGRIKTRTNNHSRLAAEDDENWQRSVTHFKDIKGRLLSGIDQDELGTRVIIVDGSRPIELSVDEIEDWILRNVADTQK